MRAIVATTVPASVNPKSTKSIGKRWAEGQDVVEVFKGEL